jgi:hypothetical protein
MLSKPILISLKDLNYDKKNTGENGSLRKKEQEKLTSYDMKF